MDFFTNVMMLQVETEFIPEDNPDIIAMNSKAQMPHVKDYVFDLLPVVFVGKTVSTACSTVIYEGLK